MKSENNLLDSSSEVKPFLGHLEDLRGTILKIAGTVLLSTLLCFIFARKILEILKWPLSEVLHMLGQEAMQKEILRSLTPAGGFILSVKLAFFSGLILALPFCLYFFTQFISPGLTLKEKNYLLPIFLSGSILFLLGALLCYGVALPQCLKFFWHYNENLGIVPLWTIENYISFSVFLILSFGLAFEIPLIILALVKFGVLSHTTLRTKRRLAIVFIFITAALLTPSPDAFSQILLAIPMILLYEMCVWLSAKIKR